ncbi:MAG: RNA polymerase-associated protein RapA [Fibrobacterales bacterium]
MADWQIGQRWLSEAEPELGLGAVIELAGKTVKLEFPAVNEIRMYVQENAPLRRYALSVGDTIQSLSGLSEVVTEIKKQNGLRFFFCGDEMIPETEIAYSATIPKDELLDKILHLEFDSNDAYELRIKAHEINREIIGSRTRGLIGPKVSLIPHQFYIADSSVTKNRLPRKLLADEVGLGKTIEAGLIYHQLKLTSRVTKTLILTPPSLKHQWMVELYRRFNQMFTIIDEEAVEALCGPDEDTNPFESAQEILCDIDYLIETPDVMEDLLNTKFDLLIVDEAHHYELDSPETAAQYALLKALCDRTPGVLLLTATPEQLNPVSHFNRLQLLDPLKYSTFEEWQENRTHYSELAHTLEALLQSHIDGHTITWKDLIEAFPNDNRIHALAESTEHNFRPQDVIRHLIDTMGTGEVMVRNTRAAIGGFPGRAVHGYALDLSTEYRDAVTKYQAVDTSLGFAINNFMALDSDAFKKTTNPLPKKTTLSQLWLKDERVVWLAQFLEANHNKKILCICAHKQTVLALKEAIDRIYKINIALFYEEMSLVARDRAAAWFAEDEGARLLIASEIGSEGRNFQFSHDLVLFDLMPEPGVIDQRIGRLDRIGQTETINIHVPYVAGTALEALFTWHHSGLNSLNFPILGGDTLYHTFFDQLHHFLANGVDDSFSSFIESVQKETASVRQTLEEGRDKLLELNSFDKEYTEKLLDSIKEQDESGNTQEFAFDVLSHIGLDIEKAPHPYSWVFLPNAQMKIDSFPGIPEEGLTVTTSREQALVRDDLAYLSTDHPVTLAALDMTLGTTAGQAAFVTWKKSPKSGLYFEFSFTWHVSSSPEWGVQHLLVPQNYHMVFDVTGKEFSTLNFAEELIDDGQPAMLEPYIELIDSLVPNLKNHAYTLLQERVEMEKVTMTEEVAKSFSSDLERVQFFCEGSDVKKEIALIKNKIATLSQAISSTDIQLDGIRIVLAE